MSILPYIMIMIMLGLCALQVALLVSQPSPVVVGAAFFTIVMTLLTAFGLRRHL